MVNQFKAAHSHRRNVAPDHSAHVDGQSAAKPAVTPPKVTAMPEVKMRTMTRSNHDNVVSVSVTVLDPADSAVLNAEMVKNKVS